MILMSYNPHPLSSVRVRWGSIDFLLFIFMKIQQNCTEEWLPWFALFPVRTEE